MLLYIHQKRDVFYLHLYQGSTLSLTNVVTYPHCFLTAYKMTSRSSVLAGMSDSKNPDTYYCRTIRWWIHERTMRYYQKLLLKSLVAWHMSNPWQHVFNNYCSDWDFIVYFNVIKIYLLQYYICNDDGTDHNKRFNLQCSNSCGKSFNVWKTVCIIISYYSFLNFSYYVCFVFAEK